MQYLSTEEHRKALQERLKALGLYNGNIDGVLGPESSRAIQAARVKFKLPVNTKISVVDNELLEALDLRDTPNPVLESIGLALRDMVIQQVLNKLGINMNTNLIHNIINIIIVLTAAATAGVLATGCTTLPTGGFDCSQSWLDPTISSYIIVGLGALKVVINIARDGITGLVKSQPPVEK